MGAPGALHLKQGVMGVRPTTKRKRTRKKKKTLETAYTMAAVVE